MIDLDPSRNLAVRSRAGCFQVLFLLAGWLALVTPLRADNPPTYLFEIDSSAVPGGFRPFAVALDSSNNIYAIDGVNNRVVKFTAGGTYLAQWGGSGTNNGQFNGSSGIAVDASNNVYVTDANNNRVQKFTSNGNYLTQWGSLGTNNGQLYQPYAVALDSSNNVYVTDGGNNRVEKFDSNGSYLTQWGDYGSGNGQFRDIGGVAVDSSNNVYVTDGGNSQRVEKFDGNGNYLRQWGNLGSGNGQFHDLDGVGVDRNNNVYVVDTGNSRIEKFDSSGAYLTQWGSYGSGVAVDGTGNYIYIAEPYRIEIFANNTNINPPLITRQPVSQTVLTGSGVTFSVSVVGAAPLAYQWNSNNVTVPGATNATFTLANVSLSASGTYSVLVTNNFGRELSSNLVLTVLPALVTTQPASGISLTGAVLNGSVTVGLEETVVWFEWGMDTNYGNVVGAAIVAGNNGSNGISAALNGLNGNIVYHCRIVAANDFGIVYGNDQSFTVGFAPAARTLPAVTSANVLTLNATVNPEGWDTTVYFLWGNPTLTNSTPGMDIGAGATSLNVSSFATGLATVTPYYYQVVASNALGTVLGVVGTTDTPDPIVPPGGGTYLSSQWSLWLFNTPIGEIEMLYADLYLTTGTLTIVGGTNQQEQFSDARMYGESFILGSSASSHFIAFGPATIEVFGNVGKTTGTFDTAILGFQFYSFDPTGLIRQSTHMNSTGRTTITYVGGGVYHIDSFFNVYADLSIDGGNTWHSSPSYMTFSLAYDVVSTPPPVLLSNVGVGSNQFGFDITGVSNQVVVVEASTDLVSWTALSTNTLGAAPFHFSDPGRTNFQTQYFRAELIP